MLRQNVVFISVAILAVAPLSGDDAAVVMDRDNKVSAIVPHPSPVSVDEIRENYHQVGGADPDFVPPSPPVTDPGVLPSGLEQAEMGSASGGQRQEQGPVVTLDFSDQRVLPLPEAEALPEAPLPQPLFEPNQSGIIVLPGRSRTSMDQGIANPFDIRMVGTQSINEIKVKVGGVVMGGQRPTAIINGRPFSANERWSSFNVVSIRKDAVLMERDGVFILLPRGRQIVIKIPL